jgi:hypothetical protein
MTDDIFKPADRSVADDLSPVWRMLAEGTSEPVVRALPQPGRSWQSVLAEGVTEAAASGRTLVIPVEKPLARAVLSLLANRKWSMVKTPSVGKIKDELHRLGARVDNSFALWPSARTPRIAFPEGRTRLVHWAQRSGVLGGGGNRLWARSAARSPLFTPFAMLMAPGVALVVKVRRQADA